MLTFLRVFCLVYTIMYAISIVHSLATSSRRAPVENDLQQQGISITGRLTGQISPNVPATWLPFTYEYAGKTYKQRQWVSKPYAKAFPAEASVTILALPEKPEIAMLANIPPDHWESRILKRRARTAFIFCCIALLFSILLFSINR